jgi:hypothetical protein
VGREKRADDGAPVGKGRRLAEVDGVVFQRVPEDLQDVALGAFNALVDLEALEALGFGNHFADAALDGFVKSGLLAGVDADVGEFENHEKAPLVDVSVLGSGNSTVNPSSAGVRVIWQLSRLEGLRGAAVNSSMPSSSPSGGGRLEA